MTTTTLLQLPLLAAAQAQKHVTHNEAIVRLDALVQMSVISRGEIEPPANPSDSDRYMPASGAIDIWEDWDLNIALYVDGVWTKLVPRAGWMCWVEDEQIALVWDGTAWALIGGRELLTAARTYYVDPPSGFDSNDGLTPGTAFATIQKAWETLVMLDLGGNDVTIQLADGTYGAGLLANVCPVGGNVVINGNASAPANVIVSMIDVNCVAKVTVQNFKSEGGTHGLRANVAGAYVIVGEGMVFGASSFQMTAANNGYIQVRESYEIASGASRHLNVSTGAIIRFEGDGMITVTLTGTPNFSSAFAAAGEGAGMRISTSSATFSGSATGKRYDASLNAFINTFGGADSFLPGNAPGTEDTGGQYA